MRSHPDQLVAKCSSYYFVPVPIIFGTSRQSHIVHARHMAMLLMRRELKWSYAAIADYFGMDHTTVMSALRKFGAKIERPSFQREIKELLGAEAGL